MKGSVSVVMWGIRLRKAGRREVPQEQVEMLIEQVMFEHTCWALHNMLAVVFVCLCMVYRSQLDEIRVIVNTKFWFLFFYDEKADKIRILKVARSWLHTILLAIPRALWMARELAGEHPPRSRESGPKHIPPESGEYLTLPPSITR